MTQATDLDRQLADWLADGPNRAPDEPLNAARQFALAHPRRPDPLRAFRSDPMADRRRSPFVMRPSLVFAMLALVVAIVAAGVIGSRRDTPPVVVPPSDGPSASVPPPPSASPLPSGSPAPSAAQFSVALETTSGRPATAEVVDLSGLVVGARSGPAIEGGTVDGVVVTNDKADSLLITWSGTPCDTVHRVTIDATATHVLVERPICRNDSIARDLSLILTFSRSIAASDVAAEIVEGKGAGGVLPNWTLSGPDTAGNVFHVQIFDASGKLTGAESTSQGGATTVAPDSGRVEQVGPDTIKLVWARDACVVDERLDIDGSLLVLTLTGAACGSSGSAFERETDLTFSSAVSAADLEFKVETQTAP